MRRRSPHHHGWGNWANLYYSEHLRSGLRERSFRNYGEGSAALASVHFSSDQPLHFYVYMTPPSCVQDGRPRCLVQLLLEEASNSTSLLLRAVSPTLRDWRGPKDEERRVECMQLTLLSIAITEQLT